jgi:hypothetical protein
VHAVGIPFFPSLIQNSNQMAVIPDSTTFLQHTLTCQHSTNCFLLMLLWFTEEMVQGLQQVSWQKVDVSFHSALWPFLAHGAIHVKHKWLHYEGAGVIAHVAETLKQQESCVSLEASS